MTAVAVRTPQTRPGDDARRVEARVLCWELRLQGLSIRMIAVAASDQLGYKISPATVHRLIREEADEKMRQPREDYRAYELDRLDRYLAVLEPKVRAGDVSAVQTAVRVSESRRKLLGLDAPVQVEATVHEVTQVDVELAEILRDVL